MNVLVSIIIPIYNAEKYLEKCINSILNQNYKEIEVILVDDGSTDRSSIISDNFKKKDNRVIVHHQNNLGVVEARKKGVELASSEYVIFVDADDYVDDNYVFHLMKYASKYELVTSGAFREEKNGGVTNRHDGIGVGQYTNDCELAFFRDNMIFLEGKSVDGVLPYMVTKCYRRSLALDVMLEMNSSLEIYEDRAFVLCYIERCNSIYVTHEMHYYYQYNESSVMHSHNMRYINILSDYFGLLDNYFAKYYYSRKLKIALQKFLMDRLCSVTKFMDFDWRVQSINYYHPFGSELNDKKIVIYGAGEVGCNYYRELVNVLGSKNICWVDKDFEKISKENPLVKSVAELNSFQYDTIIIAVKSENLAKEITHELIELNISKEVIKWKYPIVLKEL